MSNENFHVMIDGQYFDLNVFIKTPHEEVLAGIKACEQTPRKKLRKYVKREGRFLQDLNKQIDQSSPDTINTIDHPDEETMFLIKQGDDYKTVSWTTICNWIVDYIIAKCFLDKKQIPILHPNDAANWLTESDNQSAKKFAVDLTAR